MSRLSRLTLAVCATLALSCGDGDGPAGPVATGSIRVSLTTSSGDADADGCTVAVDTGSTRRLASGEETTFSGLSAGDHSVFIGDVAGRCQVDGSVSQSVTVAAGQTVQVTFTLVCDWRSRIAFKSLHGGEGIYAMIPDGTELVRLSDGVDSDPAWSPDGIRIAFSRVEAEGWGIWVMDADGTDPSRLTRQASPTYYPAWSPDGTRIAFTHQHEGDWEIYVMNTTGMGLVNLTRSPGWDARPSWSPDGTRIAFVRGHAHPEICVMNADGTGALNLTDSPPNDYPAWSPDGTRIAFDSQRDGNREIYVMNADGTGQRNLTNHPFRDAKPSWSPDGTRIAFECDRGDGVDGVCVMNADGTDVTKVTGHPGDHGPAWSPYLF